MKKVQLIATALGVILLGACKKNKNPLPESEPETTTTQVTYPNYSNLKVGNYWIYQRFSIDQAGNSTALTIIDSCYIEKDTTINGKQYFKYMSPNMYYPLPGPGDQNPPSPEYLRDSLSYLVSSNGQIEFSSQDFTTIFRSGYNTMGTDTIYKYEIQMGDKDMNTATPAGNFITSAYKEKYSFYPNYSTGGAVRYRKVKYAANVGKVSEGLLFFLSSPTHWERRLIRYHLN